MIINPNDKMHEILSNAAARKAVNVPNMIFFHQSKPRLTSKGYEVLMELDSGKSVMVNECIQ